MSKDYSNTRQFHLCLPNCRSSSKRLIQIVCSRGLRPFFCLCALIDLLVWLSKWEVTENVDGTEISAFMTLVLSFSITGTVMYASRTHFGYALFCVADRDFPWAAMDWFESLLYFVLMHAIFELEGDEKWNAFLSHASKLP